MPSSSASHSPRSPVQPSTGSSATQASSSTPQHPPSASLSRQRSTKRSVRVVPQTRFSQDGDSSSDEDTSHVGDQTSQTDGVRNSPVSSASMSTSRLSSIVGPEVFVNKASIGNTSLRSHSGMSSPTSSRSANGGQPVRPGASTSGMRRDTGMEIMTQLRAMSDSTHPYAAGEHASAQPSRSLSFDQISDDDDEDDDNFLERPISSNQYRTVLEASRSSDSRERLEWRSMLSSVLSGDVLRGESSRIGLDKPGEVVYRKRLGQSLWWQIRARMRGRSEVEEKRRLEERRGRVVDTVLEEIEGFVLRESPPKASASAEPVAGDTPSDSMPEQPRELSTAEQIGHVLQKLALVEALYPHQAAFRAAKPLYDSPNIQTRIHALTGWYTIITSLQAQLAVLQLWTGTDDLDILRPNTTKEKALVGKNTYHPLDTKAKNRAEEADQAADDSSFLERISKQEHIKKTFEKRIFSDMMTVIHAAKATVIAYQPVFEEMHLPDFRSATLKLITFPARLVMESLKYRLKNTHVNVNETSSAIAVQESLDGFRLTLSLAVLIKRQYEEVLEPDVDGRWNIPQCLPAEYDYTLLNGIRAFFRVLHLRLKLGERTLFFGESDVLEAEWQFLGEVGEAVPGADLVVAEHFCALTHRLLARAYKGFQAQMQADPMEIAGQNHHLSAAQVREYQVAHFGKMLDIARMRYRKLQRFARRLAQRFDNSAEYTFEDDELDTLIERLITTGHFLVYTSVFEEAGTYIIASEPLWNDPHAVRQLLQRAFSPGVMNLYYNGKTQPVDGYQQDVAGPDGVAGASVTEEDEAPELVPYLILLSSRQSFAWTGGVMTLDLDLIDFAVPDNRARLIADGPAARLALTKQVFQDAWSNDDSAEPELFLHCLIEQQAHLPRLQRELLRIGRSGYRLSESFIQSASIVASTVGDFAGSHDLVENWYLFGSDHGRRVTPQIDESVLERFSKLLMRLSIGWVQFISDSCDPTDRKTFRWTVQALDHALKVTGDGNILYLDPNEFAHLRKSVAALVSLLISHFDILGARSGLEAKKEAERIAAMRRLQRLQENFDDDFIPRTPSPNGQSRNTFDRSIRLVREERLRLIAELEEARLGTTLDVVGQVLDEEVSEDRALVFLAASASNIAIKWQQGGFIGGGANGDVYIGINSENGSVMAVKEIRVQDLSNSPALYKQIKDESDVMSMLSHPNIVEYYGIEVHRDRVYIFEEYCSNGSLAKTLETGRIEDEDVTRTYASQILSGLEYLHSKGVEHRDIKPDNILLAEDASLKLVDFGAAKVIAKGNKTMARTRAARSRPAGAAGADPKAVVNSLAGTPMYMAPEVIRNEKGGKLGSSDIWSMGCVILQIATGRKPWNNLDNEWAIMFHIGIATQHPPLPDPDQLSDLGIDFIERCLTLDPTERPTAAELREHKWMQLLAEQHWDETQEDCDYGQYDESGAYDEYQQEEVQDANAEKA